MASSTTPSAPHGSLLEPMNLHNPIEFDELLRQRVICGWDNTVPLITAWRTSADAGTLSNYWVVPASLSQLPAPQRYAGHISMGEKTEPPNDTAIKHLANLFILPEHRLGGLGRKAVLELETWAKRDGCKATTLNTISRKYIEDDAEEWRGFYTRVCESLGIPVPEKGTGNEDWYVRMGFVKTGEVPLYPITLDGEKIMLLATLLRKELV